MNLSLFYDWFVQIGLKWNLFINDQPENLQQAAQKFKTDFISQGYGLSVFVLIVCTLLVAFYYYGPYNNKPGFRYRRSHWLIFMGINALLVFIVTSIFVSTVVSSSFIYKTMYLAKLSFINAVYSSALYVLFAFFVALIMPKRTNADKLF